MKMFIRCLAVCACFLLISTWCGAQIWNPAGNPDFSAGFVNYTTLAFDKAGTAYVAYEDFNNGEKATVMKLSGGTWVGVGSPGFSAGSADWITLALDTSGMPYVVYEDGANSLKASVMKYNGTSWVNVGSPGISAGEVWFTSIAIIRDTPYIAYEDWGNGQRATVMKYNGSAWVPVGSVGFTPTFAFNENIKSDTAGVPYMAFEDASVGARASVMKFDGTNWSYAGIAGFSAGSVQDNSLYIDKHNTIYLGFQDAGYALKASVMKYNGTAWTYVGGGGISAGVSSYCQIAEDTSGTMYLAYDEGTPVSPTDDTVKVTAKKFNGTSWVNAGNPYFSSGVAEYVSLAIDPYGVPYVAYRDGGDNDMATVMKLGISPITGTDSVCAGATTLLTDTTAGGVWSSSNTSIATISTAGIVTGITAGRDTIYYAAPMGTASVTITADPLPVVAAISGIAALCGSTTTLLHDISTGGIWSSSNTGIATVTTAGIVYGLDAGVDTISYAVTNSCGTATAAYTVTVNAPPMVYTVTGGGPYCAGGAGAVTGLSNSGTGISYQLYNGSAVTGSPVAGTGSAISFGGQSVTGVYAVLATNTVTGCTTSMADSAVISINPLPGTFAVTGGGSYCAGSAGVAIGLGGSAAGISYGLYNGAAVAGTALPGTGVSLNFGIYTAAGTYTVMGTNTVSGCTSPMNDSAVVVINPLPHEYTVTGGGSYCAGSAGALAGLSGSDTGVSYQLYLGAPAIETISGTGAAISFGTQSVVGTYTVLATNASTGCTNDMAGSAVVSITAVVYDSLHINTFPATACAGSTVSYITNTVGGGTAPAYLWTVNGSAVTGSSFIYSYTPVNGDVVSCTMTSSFPCAIPAMVSDTVVTTVLPIGTPSVGISPATLTVCDGYPVTFTPAPSFGGTAPLYAWLINGVYEDTGATYTYEPENHDAISCILTSNYACRTADSGTSSSEVITVLPLSVPSALVIAVPSGIRAFDELDTLVVFPYNTGPNPLYQWFINDTLIAGATADTFISNDFRNLDSVSCQVTTTGTCAGITTFNWAIINEYRVGVQQLRTGNDIQLFPNPNNGSFTLKGNWATADDADALVEITDMLGQVMYKNTARTTAGKMDERVQTGALASGMYLVHIQRREENRVFRFVVAE